MFNLFRTPFCNRFRMPARRFARAAAVSCLLSASGAQSSPFEQDVRGFFQKYCLECHTTAEPKGGMDLEVIQRAEDFLEHPTALTHVIEVLENGDMPPRKAKQPAASEADRALKWLVAELNRQQNASPNDPGVVVAPRLNSTEYGNAIRAFTGSTAFDASSFITAEGGAGEGFSNVGEAHSMGTSTFESYLSAANRVLSYARATPAGVTWFDFPQVETASNQDLVRSLRQNWIDWQSVTMNEFSEAHRKELRDATEMTWGAYMERAWQFRHAAALRLPWKTIDDAAAVPPKLVPTMLKDYHDILTKAPDVRPKQVAASPFIEPLRQRWNALTPAALATEAARRKAFKDLEAWYNLYTEDGRWTGKGGLEDIAGSGEPNPDVGRSWEGGTGRLLANLARARSGRVFITLTDMGDGNDEDFVILTAGRFRMADGSVQPMSKLLPTITDARGKSHRWGTDAAGGQVGPEEIGFQAPVQIVFAVPANARRLDVTFKTHPKGKNGSVNISIDDTAPEIVEGRVLGRRVLNASQSTRAKAFLDRLRVVNAFGREFGRFPRTNGNNAFFEVPWMNPELAKLIDAPWPQRDAPGDGIFRLTPAQLLERARPELRDRAQSLSRQFADLASTSDLAKDRVAAQRLLGEHAARAWRRPPSNEEINGLLKLYDTDRAAGLTFDFSVKTALKAVLVSSEFLYRFQEARNSTEPYPISDRDLAVRLAFFLWAGPPDEELLKLAAAGRLQDVNTLKAQARRMLADPRAATLATEFAGHWLHYAGFDDFTGPDAEKFKDFTPAVRAAMFQEAVLFMQDLLQNNRPLDNLIQADYTFVNEPLARLYGINGVKGPEMRRVSTAGTPRGGILTMGSVLTKHSAPLRTSPIKRGVWVYEQVLGVRLPPPPPVPLISDEETNAEGLTIAQQIEKHRADPSCAACHAKFDALGFALENFDPIGRWRTKDGAGNPLETNEKIHTGQVIAGLDGLRAYIRGRMDEVILNYCRKLAGYALGRGILVTDKPLLDEMLAAVKAAGNKPQAALDVLLASRQFRFRRDEALQVADTPETSTPAHPALVSHR